MKSTSGRERWVFPPAGLVLCSVCSVQLGAAFAKVLFAELGPAGTVLLRTGFAALVLLALWRPWRSWRLPGRRDATMLVLFGFTLAAMNLLFYEALSRIPLGIAVTLEFVGPLSVAVLGSRRPLDLIWVALAAAGILLLAPVGLTGAPEVDPVGAAFALSAGGFWAAYIVIGARAGRVFPGGAGLALALGLSTLLLVPFGTAGAGAALLRPELLAAGLGVALLSSAIPYSLEFEALRRIPARVFGVLMSLEPAVGALFGFVVLGEALGPRALVAIAFVVVASAGMSLVKSSDTASEEATKPPQP